MELPSTLKLPMRLDRAEQVITRYVIDAPAGTTVDHLLEPDYWVHVAGRLLRTPNKGIGDEVRVRAEDGSFDVELTVVAVDFRGLWVQMRPLRIWQLGMSDAIEVAEPLAPDMPDVQGYRIEHSGPHGWRIIDAAGNVAAKELPDRPAALAELARIKAEKPAAAKAA